MLRKPLLALLTDYGQRHPDEAAVVDRFRTFVSANPRCFERDLWAGHVTGSAWLVDSKGESVLLTHHRKLGRWLQLGGHSDGIPDVLAVARMEAEEESGLVIQALGVEVFDLDIHEIPPRKGDPAHFHYDARFVFQATGSQEFTVSPESIDLAWVPIERLAEYTDELSMLRMAEKWAQRRDALLSERGAV